MSARVSIKLENGDPSCEQAEQADMAWRVEHTRYPPSLPRVLVELLVRREVS